MALALNQLTAQTYFGFVNKNWKKIHFFSVFRALYSLPYSVETPNSILLSLIAKRKGQLQIVQQKSAGNENRPKSRGYKKDIFYRAVQNNTLDSTKIQYGMKYPSYLNLKIIVQS